MRISVILASLVLLPTAARADPPAEQPFAIHGQATLVIQATPNFASPYAGPNSLTPKQTKETVDGTLFAGLKPWRGGELWVNPEIDQGFGLSDTLGVAGFPSAEAYKVGKSEPYARLQRLFFRQTINLGGGSDDAVAAANQLAQKRNANRIVITVGKFGVGDVFDTNRYAHDARSDFLNWTLVDTGSFDYAADAWGYSTGIAGEWYQGPWTLRVGLFNLSTVPNGESLERGFSQNQLVGEIEHRHRLGGHNGALRATVFRNRGSFGRFDEALSLSASSGLPPDTALVRRRMSRVGFALNAEQEIAQGIGIFARAGLTDGSIEPYDFTDVDRTIAVGAAVNGQHWGRPHDGIGIGMVLNGISQIHRRYLAAGGIGILIGDGRLPRAANEAILETYYQWRPIDWLALSADYQLVGNPGYNPDRGPVHVLSLRLHGQF